MNVHILTMAKTDTKVKIQVLTNILHCSVDRKIVLRAQELAPSGIMLVILSQKNASIYKQSKAFEFWHLKGSGQDLKILLKKVKYPPVTYLCSLFAHLRVLSLSQKHGDDQFSMILQQFTSYVLVCQLNNFIIYNTHLYTRDVCALGAEKNKTVNLHTTITMVKIDHTIRPLLTTQRPPPAMVQEYTVFLCGGEGIVWPPLPTLTGLEEKAEQPLLLLLSEVN